MKSAILALSSLAVVTTSAFVVVRPASTVSVEFRLYDADPIVSPFDNNNNDDDSNGDAVATTTTTSDPSEAVKIEGPLDLTWENVDLVLEEMRPFLIQDGGNVAISDIDGPVVKLELQVRMVPIMISYHMIFQSRKSNHKYSHSLFCVVFRAPAELVLRRRKP